MDLFDPDARLETILDEWHASPLHSGCNDFIRDGAIDPQRWRQASLRVLYLLKEGYIAAGDTWRDLRAVLRQELEQDRVPYSRTYRVLLEWNALLRAGASSADSAPDFFLEAAVVNIKKSNGRSQSDLNEIAAYARNDSDFLRKQLNLLSPHVIVCCNTWEAMRGAWQQVPRRQEFPAETGIDPNLLFVVDGRWVVNYWHPRAHWKTNEKPEVLNDFRNYGKWIRDHPLP